MAKYTQLSIDEQIEQLIRDEEKAHPQEFVYLDEISLDNDSFIVGKLDWYTLMIEDHSINEVIAWIGLEDKFRDRFFEKHFARNCGMFDSFIFLYNGVCIQVNKFYLYNHQMDISVFDLKLPTIRLDLSGSGLNYLRSEGIDVDDILRDSDYLLSNSHLTRADFAFDFINYKPEFIDQMIHYCNNYHTSSERIVCCGLTSALKYEVKTGGQKTVYIGANGSDQLLRIYDKRMQHVDLESGVYIKHNPYNNPDSWIRVELQLRNSRAHKLCVSECEFGGVLNYIISHYKFADTTTPAHRREPWQPWQDFVDYASLPPIIQNLQYVEKTRTVKEKVRDSFQYRVRSFILDTSMESVEGVMEQFIKINLWLLEMQTNLHDPIQEKRWRIFINMMNQCDIEPGVQYFKDGLYMSESGYILFGISKQTAYNLLNIEDYLQSYLDKGYMKNNINFSL